MTNKYAHIFSLQDLLRAGNFQQNQLTQHQLDKTLAVLTNMGHKRGTVRHYWKVGHTKPIILQYKTNRSQS